MSKFKVGDYITPNKSLYRTCTKGKKYKVTKLLIDGRGAHPFFIQDNGNEDWADKLYFKLFKRKKITDWRGEFND